MSFCQNCGSKLDASAKFCSACGFRVQKEESPTFKGEPSGSMNGICPGCGSPISSFSAICPYCGREITNQFRATACQRLCDKLEAIEMNRPKEGFFSNISKFIGNNISDRTGLNLPLRPIDQQKMELISNFVIPNTKADLLEFISLAETRIASCMALAESTSDNYNQNAQEQLAEVWRAKYEQTIEKAKLSLAKDDDFQSFYARYIKNKRIEEGRCAYCGGKFKGLFHRICTNCGKEKDY